MHKKEGRIKIKLLKENLGIAGNSNEAISLATGNLSDFSIMTDELAPFALYEIACLLNRYQI